MVWPPTSHIAIAQTLLAPNWNIGFDIYVCMLLKQYATNAVQTVHRPAS